MDPATEPGDVLNLADYRRRVADLYTGLRARGVDAEGWRWWRSERERLLTTHPQSALAGADGIFPDAPPFFPYDPAWQVIAHVQPAAPDAALLRTAEGTFTNAGTAIFEHGGERQRLTLYWLDAYGGGLFLPFKDGTNGGATYGGGRYLLDGAKSADLGPAPSAPSPTSDPLRRLLLDFNFAYHPSCAWNPRWACPLAPPTNLLSVAVNAGERLVP